MSFYNPYMKTPDWEGGTGDWVNKIMMMLMMGKMMPQQGGQQLGQTPMPQNRFSATEAKDIVGREPNTSGDTPYPGPTSAPVAPPVKRTSMGQAYPGPGTPNMGGGPSVPPGGYQSILNKQTGGQNPLSGLPPEMLLFLMQLLQQKMGGGMRSAGMGQMG